MFKVLTTGFLVILSGIAGGADWAQWRGPTRDSQIAEEDWPDSIGEDSLVKRWSVPLGPGYSGPVVVGNRVFVTETRDESHEVVRALDRHSGDEIWKVEWPGSTSVPFFARENGSWIRSTPICDGERLYVAGIRDVLVALKAESGEIIWRVDLAKELDAELPAFGTVCSPLIDGEFIYIQAAASLVKLRKSDGTVVWRSPPQSGGAFGSAMEASAFSSPVSATLAGTRQIVVQSRKSLSGYDLQSGIALWSVDVPAFRGMNILTPLVIGDSVLTSSYGGGTFLYDITRSGDAFAAAERWSNSKQGYMSSPVLIDEQVYLHLRNQRFTCIDPKDGTEQWTSRPFGKYWSTVVNGNRMLALDQNGELHLINSSTSGFQDQSRRISDSDTWAHLAVSADQLFIRELNAITMWSWE